MSFSPASTLAARRQLDRSVRARKRIKCVPGRAAVCTEDVVRPVSAGNRRKRPTEKEEPNLLSTCKVHDCCDETADTDDEQHERQRKLPLHTRCATLRHLREH